MLKKLIFPKPLAIIPLDLVVRPTISVSIALITPTLACDTNLITTQKLASQVQANAPMPTKTFVRKCWIVVRQRVRLPDRTYPLHIATTQRRRRKTREDVAQSMIGTKFGLWVRVRTARREHMRGCRTSVVEQITTFSLIPSTWMGSCFASRMGRRV